MANLSAGTLKGLTLKRHPKTATITPFTPTLPDVNLLPPRVLDAALAKKAQRKLAMIGGAVAIALALGYAGQTAQIMLANHSLDVVTAKGVTLNKQVADLSPIKAFYGGVEAQKAVVQKTMVHEMLFSKVASDLLNSRTAGVSVQTMAVSAGGATSTTGAPSTTGASCPLADPFAANPVPSVTCVQFTGTATGRDSLSSFLTGLNSGGGFVNTYVPVTDSGDGKQVTFNGSVGITDKFFSNRYADDGYLLKGSGATQ